jgi:hypothetical protein
LLADCDFSVARDKRWPGTENDVFADRRPELYRSLDLAHGPGDEFPAEAAGRQTLYDRGVTADDIGRMGRYTRSHGGTT